MADLVPPEDAAYRRTPSQANLQLAELDLPAPSRISQAVKQAENDSRATRITTDLSQMKMQDPEALAREAEERENEDRQDALAEVISSLDLPEPERMVRAGMRADGRKTPDAQQRTEAGRIISPPASPTIARAPSLKQHRAHASTSAAAGPKQKTLHEAAVVTETPVQAGTSDQVVTPWDVEGAVVDGKQVAIDYEKLVKQFGTSPITPELLARFEKATGVKPHLLLRRGIFFSHRELERILDRFEKKETFYLYTGRGPSSDNMHLGHMIPFNFTAYLQKAFGCVCVIQLTDDEKFFFKPGLTIEQVRGFARSNAKDIIACGFDPEKTFIFNNLDFVGGAFYHNVARIASGITYNQSRATFGFTESDSVAKCHFVAVQAAPSFSNSFPQIFGENSQIPCLIPCAIDQDPYFRLTRDAATRLRYPKPALIHAKFFPALQGAQSKMSASNAESSIFMNDTPAQIKKKINKYAFSGGQTTTEEHQRLGGNPDVDVAYQYLLHLEDDDAEMERLAVEYRAGRLLTGELKKICIEKLQGVVGSFQEQRAKVDEEVLNHYFDRTRRIDGALRPRGA